MASINGSGENRRGQWDSRAHSPAVKVSSKSSSIHQQLRTNINSIRSRSAMFSERKSSVYGFVSAIGVSSKDKNLQMVYDLDTKELRDASSPRYRTTAMETIRKPEVNPVEKPEKSTKTPKSERKRCNEQRKKLQPMEIKKPCKNNSYGSVKLNRISKPYSDVNRKKLNSAGSDRFNNRHPYADKRKPQNPKWKELLNITEKSLLASELPTKVMITHTRVIPDETQQEFFLQENVTVQRRIPFKEVNSEFLMHLAELEMKKMLVKENVLQLDTADSKGGIGFVKRKRVKGEPARIPYDNKRNVLRKVESSPSLNRSMETESSRFDFQEKMMELAKDKPSAYQHVHHNVNTIPASSVPVKALDEFSAHQHIQNNVHNTIPQTPVKALDEFYDWPDRPSIFKGVTRASLSTNHTPPRNQQSSLIFSRSIESLSSDEEGDIKPVESVINGKVKEEAPVIIPPQPLFKQDVLARTSGRKTSSDLDFNHGLRLNHQIMALKRADGMDAEELVQRKVVTEKFNSAHPKSKKFNFNFFRKKRNVNEGG